MASLLLAVALVPIAASTALGQDSDTEQARAEFNRGVERYDTGDYQGALEAFQEAYRLRPNPSVRVNMANCYEQLGRPLEALFHFERFLNETEGQASPQQRREVDAAITRIRRQIGEIVLRVAPDGARITIDSGETRRAPVMDSVKVTAGTHTVEISLDGYRTERREINVAGGATETVEVSLQREGEAETQPVESGGGETAEAGESGDQWGTGESGEGLASGGEGSEGGATGQQDTGGGGGGFHLTTPVIAVGAATVGLALMGTVTGIMALRANSDFDADVRRSHMGTDAERAAAYQAGLDDKDKANRRALVTDILLVSALVGAGVTTFLVFYTAGDDDEQQADAGRWIAAPAVGPRGGGLVLSRSF